MKKFIYYFLFFLIFINKYNSGIAKEIKNYVLTNKIKQHGITWHFDHKYKVGKFANGDFWIIGPVTIIAINPKSINESGRIKNGSMINPSPKNGTNQGYDNTMYGSYGPNYNSNLNVAYNISKSHSLKIYPNNSLVSTIGIEKPESIPQIKIAAILTVLSKIPANNSFRPAYCGVPKNLTLSKDMIIYKNLSSLSKLNNTPSIPEFEKKFQKVWLDHVPGWMGRFIHPSDNMPDYGRDMASLIGDATLLLNLNYSNLKKQKLLIYIIQLGIDLYGIVKDGGHKNWYPNGGHASGRKWPILFAGIMLNNNEMKNIGKNKKTLFGEDAQTFYIDKHSIKISNSNKWKPKSENKHTRAISYTKSDIGIPEWGIRHAVEPEKDHKTLTSSYRRCCTANSWVGIILSVHIMNAKKLWNHDALFDYQDRYMYNLVKAQKKVNWLRSWSSFSEKMWDKYRKLYPQIWENK